MQPLTDEQIQFAIDCMAEWIHYRGQGVTSADIDHSCLLQRLLRGKPALKKTPPKRFSCPDYDLGEGKEVEIYEINELPDDFPVGEVCIDQDSNWNWQDKDNNILIYNRSGELYKYYNKENKKYLQKITHSAGDK